MRATLYWLGELKETVVVVFQNPFFNTGTCVALTCLEWRIILRIAGNCKPPPGLVAGTTLLWGAGVRTSFSLKLEFFDNKSLV